MIYRHALEMDEVRRWRSGFTHPPGLLDTLSQWVELPRMMVTVEFLMPVFERVRGCVLLPWVYDSENFEDWWTQLDGDRARIEETLNHIHLWDLLPDSDEAAAATVRLGEALRACWQLQLQNQVSERSFEVAFSDGDTDYGPTVSIISL